MGFPEIAQITSPAMSFTSEQRPQTVAVLYHPVKEGNVRDRTVCSYLRVAASSLAHAASRAGRPYEVRTQACRLKRCSRRMEFMRKQPQECCALMGL
jgi:hypothetical protein